MSRSDRSLPRLPLIAGIVILLLVLALGGGFLRLGMNAVPPEQTNVHKVLPASAFASAPPSSTAASAPLPAMPPVPTMPAAPGTVATPAAAPAATPVPQSATPLPTMPAPRAAPTQLPASTPAH
ncbi:hypothetical protein WH240_05920 [Gluconobacter wancherniae]|uniref:hypothetical protein n=1 Tax=Gluconobacter wancherniae TaxID=1307955 RepID=UPI0030A81F40